ncbi:hypothetical protein AMATHDRAFT_54357 [Amanita thiersii Skay4041]|uniref:C2H2-type domain-containing protein n=1 Tax=Amanita thiersii Skay4041 TaxID=703135 RepID=A0A2A9NZ20_9AGAR|nr:hypothetical protein AMATHDRAFT_54357 [Amanita thiersii Skay4041]
MATDTLARAPYPQEPLFVPGPVNSPIPQGIPTSGPATHPNGPREYAYTQSPNPVQFPPPPGASELPNASNTIPVLSDGRQSPKQDVFFAQSTAELFNRSKDLSAAPSPTSGESSSLQGGAGANHYPSSSGVPRLPPILQVEKLQVTTSATQMASASRRRNEAHFICPVPGCGSTFTRRFNLRGHLRSHTEERPYVCNWPGCKKGFARQHDCKRHQALHTAKSQSNVCQGCKKTFSRLDALNVLRSDNGADCRAATQRYSDDASRRASQGSPANIQPGLS